MKDPDNRPRSQFERRLYGALLILLAGLLALAIYSYRSLVLINSERSRLTELYSQSLSITSDLRYLKAHEDSLMSGLILSADPAIYDQVRKTRADFAALSERLARVDPSPTTLWQLKQIAELGSELIAHTDRILTLRMHGAARERTFREIGKLGTPLSTRISAALTELHRHERQEFMDARDKTRVSTNDLIRSFVLTTVIMGLGFIVIALLVVQLVRGKRLRDEARERLYEQVRKAAQARKETLEIVSHDLKNPLSAVELNLQLLLRQGPSSESASKDTVLKADSLVSNALHAIQSMKDLIQSLLDQAKLQAGTFELELQTASLVDTIEAVTRVLEPLARQKRIRIELIAAKGEPPVRIDPRRMSQVISNIVGNAIKFTPPDGRITIETASTGSGARVSVSDTGPGIPKDQQSRIFERFWQPSATRKQGTGLGLAIAKGVIEAHHGRIWVESEPGRGSTFHLVIPTSPSASGIARHDAA